MKAKERYEVVFSGACVKNGAVVPGSGPDIWLCADVFRTKDKAVERVKDIIDHDVNKAIEYGCAVLGRSDDHYVVCSQSGVVMYKRYRVELVKEVREVVVIK